MSVLQNKIDFAALITATMANPNGDPLDGNRPRTDYNGFGEITDVCIKRKIRNRMLDLGYEIFVQSDDNNKDGCKSLSERAAKYLPKINDEDNKNEDECKGASDSVDNTIPQVSDKAKYAEVACEKWLDVRAFGQVFAFKSKDQKGKKKSKNTEASENSGDETDGVSVGVRGPVTIHQAVSISPVDIDSFKITKSVNSEPGEKRSPDTMGSKHMVRFGVYLIKGSINVQLAEKTKFTEEDAEVIKECLRTLFENDASSARPEGSMEVYKLYWWEHNCKSGQYPSAKVHRLLKVVPKDATKLPTSIDDYDITLDTLDGLNCEVIDGI